MKILFHLLLLMTGLAAGTALAGSANYGKVQLIGGWQLDDGSYQAALHFDLEPGWKTYWRRPGEAGIPLQLDLSGSRNLRDFEVIWPQPKVFESYGMTSIGYENGLILPIRFIPQNPNRSIRVEMVIEFGVCSDICIPAGVQLSGRTGEDGSDAAQQAIRAALSSGPIRGIDAGLNAVECQLTPREGGFGINASIRFGGSAPKDQIVVMEYPDPDIWIEIADAERTGRQLSATLPMEYYGSGPLAFERDRLTLSLVSNERVIEIEGCRL